MPNVQDIQIVTSGESCTQFTQIGNYRFAPAAHLYQGEELTSNALFALKFYLTVKKKPKNQKSKGLD